jgi:predicted enzyme related to lactoylglutathione lyase
MAAEHNPVGWFEIPVKDMERATAFYEHLLRLKLERYQMGPTEMAWFPMKQGETGAAGTLVKGESYSPSPAGVLVYFTSPDLEGALARANEKGGKVIAPKTDIGEFGFYGLIEDTEGNHIGLHSRK